MKLLIRTMCLCIALMITSTAFALTSYSGSLSTATGGLSGSGAWYSPGVSTLGWTVSQDAAGDPWVYCYTLTVPDLPGGISGQISHMTMEASSTPGLEFTMDDLISYWSDPSTWIDEVEVGEFEPSDPTNPGGGSNPHMPGTIYGIKFDAAMDTYVATLWLETLRKPVWGDFYAKDGKSVEDTNEYNAIWNTGFLAVDPPDPPDNGSIDYHLLVPDTENGGGGGGIIPEPLTGIALVMAVGSLASYVRKRV